MESEKHIARKGHRSPQEKAYAACSKEDLVKWVLKQSTVPSLPAGYLRIPP
jgi:hypothetical protein